MVHPCVQFGKFAIVSLRRRGIDPHKYKDFTNNPPHSIVCGQAIDGRNPTHDTRVATVEKNFMLSGTKLSQTNSFNKTVAIHSAFFTSLLCPDSCFRN